MCYFMYRLRIIACLFLEYAPCKLVFFFFFANCCRVIKYLSKKKSCKWIIHCNFSYIPEAEIKTHCLHSTSACYVPCKINYPCDWLKDQATHWGCIESMKSYIWKQNSHTFNVTLSAITLIQLVLEACIHCFSYLHWVYNEPCLPNFVQA